MQSAGAFCYLKDYAKGLQLAWRSRLRDVWNDCCNGRDGLHTHPINDEALSERDAAGANGNDPQASARSKSP